MPACDPNWADVVLLLTFDGTNGSTSFPDSSMVNNPMSSANCTVSTASPMFGTGAGLFVAASSPSIFTAVSAGDPLDVNQGDVTIECWVMPVSTTGGTQVLVSNDNPGSSGSNYTCEIVNGSIEFLTADTSGHGATASAAGLVAATWNHVAFVRSSLDIQCFVNGVGGSIATQTGQLDAYDGNLFGIGANVHSTPVGTYYNGQMDELRITKGVALYTSNFTPPTQPFPTMACASIAVPDVIGETLTQAALDITSATFTVGDVLDVYSFTVPAGIVIDQDPIGGTLAATGTPVDLTVSLGPPLMPDLIGLTLPQASATMTIVGFAITNVTYASSPLPAGEVFQQGPAAGTVLAADSVISVVISLGPPEPPAPPNPATPTVISQYANSPTLLQLVENMNEYINPAANLIEFYENVWDIDTAGTFGQNIWGRILGVSRIIPIPGAQGVFGFQNADMPADWENFGSVNPSEAGSGGPFFGGDAGTGSYTLSNDAYLTLLLAKALANIAATTAPSLNALVSNLFPGFGRAYTVDNRDMTMTYVFDFALNPIQIAILQNSGVLPSPGGVQVTVTINP